VNGKVQRKVAEGAIRAESSSARGEAWLSCVTVKSNDCDGGSGNKQRGGRKLLKIKDCLETRTNAASWP